MRTIPPTVCQTISVPDELEPYCSLCLREKTDPRVMDCLHVFCLECIVGCRVIAGTYECRICKEWTCVQNNDPKNLLVDHGLANFMELKRFKEGLARCVFCSKGQSTLKGYCVVCQGFPVSWTVQRFILIRNAKIISTLLMSILVKTYGR